MHFAFPPEGFAADVLTDRSPSWFPAQAMSNYFLNNKQAAAKTTSPHPCGCPQGGERRAECRQQRSQGCSFGIRLPRAAPRTPGIVPVCRECSLPSTARVLSHLVCFHTSPCNAQTPPPEPSLLPLTPFLHPQQLGCLQRGQGRACALPGGPWRCQQLCRSGTGARLLLVLPVDTEQVRWRKWRFYALKKSVARGQSGTAVIAALCACTVIGALVLLRLKLRSNAD